ncbi:MAG: SDR family oxidoreductase [Planctomycetota bacterium]|nr:SDR family oxidoreductase [Planctomycetota bacterium]
MKNLAGKHALVTGAASGIGRAIAQQLAAAGAHLYLWDLDQEQLTRVAHEIRNPNAHIVIDSCDLSRIENISIGLERLWKLWDRVDLLVNNAGIAYYGPTENMTAEQWDRLMTINLMAPIHLTRQLLPHMLKLPEAHILNVCSISGLVAAGRFCAYHVSKFGLVGFSEALRAEYVRRGIGVTALCPGPVITKLYDSAMNGRTDRKVPNPPRWLSATPEQVAKRGIRGVQKNRGMVIVTPMAHFLWRAKRLAPGVLDALNCITRKKRKKADTLPSGNTTGIQSAAVINTVINAADQSQQHSIVPAPHISLHAKVEK